MPSQREMVERLVLEAVYAHDAGRRADVARMAQALAGRPSAPATVFALLQAEVLAVWKRGWQPAELHRSAKRELSEEHANLLGSAMAAQMRTYAVATVDERWQQQLSQIRAHVTWPSDAQPLSFLSGTGPDGGISAELAETAIEALWHLRRLPALPFTGPLPGEARQGALKPSGAPVDAKMLERVRALLAKAESTTFPEEAEAYTAKAQELMARHSIDYALLVARTGGRSEPAVRRLPIDNPYEAPKTLLLQAVADANGCRSVWSQYFAFATITGYPADLDSVELLFTSLLVQAVTAMTQSGPKQDRYGRNNTRSFRQSFLTSYAQRIGERLRGATDAVVTETIKDLGGEGELLPVLRARAHDVDAKVKELFPELHTRSIAVSNQEGWVQGRAAADRAELHGRRPVRG
ncbi:MAG: DUF2786 domain-containing protein [Hamadaea sp.]|nr:DUF2786 domain-containing protein [Hamadaea sp.]